MGIVIQPFTEDRIAAVREFNARLLAGGCVEFAFPEESERGWREFLAVEDGRVRGGYILRDQNFSIGGRIHQVAHYRLPLSEGLIDKTYVGIGAAMLRHALAQQPLLYALGMGGMDRPLPRMLAALGWRLDPVGFYFRVLRPARFLRNIRALRKTAARRSLLDLAASTGAGWLGVQALQLARFSAGPATAVNFEQVHGFGSWADELWEACHTRYGACGVRNSETLNRLYPASDQRFLISKSDRGWAVALHTQMSGDKYFGDLRVGSIVDALAQPEDAPAVIAGCVAGLAKRGVDLIVSNQRHRAWAGALRRAGFLKGPSNFIFAASKKLGELIGPFEEAHINRGDGDGPIHL